ncbi:MAG: peptidoglycan editing factor PgeF [Planktomarina temperata]|uniref:peptidoglycan editing factor PgeF n=1 Tax=Planktomarina temperata TaxID=1284658 RepID=UPI003C76A170
MTLTPLTSDLLSEVSHGFFTRMGGSSTGIYHGLNCGKGSGDRPDAVQSNRAAVADFFGRPADRLQSVHQTHSAQVQILTAPLTAAPKADAMVTATAGVILGVLTADCQPVLFHDAKARVIGAAHAGYKGAKLGILQNTLAAMETLGAQRQDICAVIGPCISQKAYEVGPEFLEEICHDAPDALRFFAQGRGDRYQFDLPSYSLDQLRAAGIKEAAWTGHCTYSAPDQFYSYRRSVHEHQPDYGRLISCICL